jgi:BMFP domain-containing protein YqiC
MERLNELYQTLVKIDAQLGRTLDVLRHELIQANQEIQALRKRIAELEAVRK